MRHTTVRGKRTRSNARTARPAAANVTLIVVVVDGGGGGGGVVVVDDDVVAVDGVGASNDKSINDVAEDVVFASFIVIFLLVLWFRMSFQSNASVNA
jgi:hypothetical protein